MVRSYAMTLGGVLALTVVMTVGVLHFVTSSSARAIENIESNEMRKMTALLEFEAAFGYRGVIHGLKNYVLRGEETYADETREAIGNARAALASYRGARRFGDDERVHLMVLDGLVDAYEDALGRLGDGGMSAEQADAIARVDDAEFLGAVSSLRALIREDHALAMGTMHELVVEGERDVAMVGMAGTLAALVVAGMLVRRLIGRVLEMHGRAESLASFAKRSTNGMVRTDTRRRVVWVNEGFERISGYTLEEARGKTPGQLLQCEGTDPATIEAMRGALERREGFRGRILNRSKGGREYWLDLEVMPEFDENGAHTGFIAIESDVTELVTAMDEAASLSEQRAWLSAAFERSADPMAVTDLDGNVRYANPAAFALDKGVGFDLRVGGPALLFGPGRVDDDVRAHLLTSVSTGERFEGRVRVYTEARASETGDEAAMGFRWLHVQSSPLVNDDGRVHGALIIKRDVTPAVEAETRSRLRAEGAEARAHITAILAGDEPLRERFERAVGVVLGMEQLDVENKGGVYLFEEGGDRLRMFAHVGGDTDYESEGMLCSSLSERAVESGDLVVSDNCLEDERHGHAREGATAHGHYIVPLMHRATCMGVLLLHTETNPSRENERLDALRLIGELFASAIVRERQDRELAQERAETDRLAERLRVATEEARVGIWDFDPGTGLVAWDARMYELFGIDPDVPATYATWAESLHPDDRERAEGELASALAGEGVFNTLFRIIDPKGRQRHLRATATIVRDAGGDVTHVIGSNWDVTESQVALERLNESQRIARMGSWSFNMATGEIGWSEQLFRLYNMDPERGTPDYEGALATFDDESAERLHRAVERAIEDGTPYSLMLRLRDESDGVRWIRGEGRARRDASGKTFELFGTATDVTNEVQYRSSLAALDSSNDCVFMFDPDTLRFVYANHGAMEQIGYGMGELSQMAPYEIKPEFDADSFARMLEPLRDEPGRSEIFRTVHEHRNGTRIPVEISLQLAGGDTGAARFVAVARDISEQLANERRLTDARDRAEEASRAKSEFLANMSHEIRTPMTAILGYSDMLATGEAEDPQRVQQTVRKIRSNADHLLTVINDILDVSKIEAGQMTVELIETDAAGLAREVLELVEPRAEAKGVALGLEFLTPVPERITSDPTRLRQILLNLMSNAIKFTEEGRVDIRVSCDPESWSVRFDVVDTGIGMSPEQLEVVSGFDAFMQADTSMTRRFGGTGLGLRISKALSGLLGGDLSVASVEGEGSTFSLTVGTGDLEGVAMLSAEDAVSGGGDVSSAEKTERESAQSKPLEGVCVLLAEDGEDNRRIIVFHLEKAGADVMVCENGLIAAETIEGADASELPDVVLMDMQMPELDGYGATARLREGGYTLPVIAITAHAMDGDREKCLKAGCDEYLTKPINKKLLIDTCVAYARGDQGGRAAA